MSESCSIGAGSTGRRRVWPLRLLKVVFAVLVLGALGRHVQSLTAEWSQQKATRHGVSMDGGWIAAATAAFLGSQVCFSLFWSRLLERSGAGASWWRTLRAYGIGTLGKYIPGKAWVVVLRTGLLPPSRTSRLSIGLTVVYETLTMMAAGGAVAAVCLLIVLPDQWWFGAGAAAGTCGLAAALHPALFGRLARLAALPFKDAKNDFSASACFSAACRWSVLSVGGWLLMGLSFWGVARAIGVPCSSIDDFLSLTGGAAFATTAGFLVLFMPAGLGVRELVMIHLLAPRFGSSDVVLATLLLRTVWTLGEVFAAGVLYALPPLVRTLTAGTVPVPLAAQTVTSQSVAANSPRSDAPLATAVASADRGEDRATC